MLIGSMDQELKLMYIEREIIKMWNINIFSFGDCDHDDFFDLQRWERIYDDDPLEVHPAFEDYDTLLARKDDLIIAAKESFT